LTASCGRAQQASFDSMALAEPRAQRGPKEVSFKGS